MITYYSFQRRASEAADRSDNPEQRVPFQRYECPVSSVFDTYISEVLEDLYFNSDEKYILQWFEQRCVCSLGLARPPLTPRPHFLSPRGRRACAVAPSRFCRPITTASSRAA